MLLYSIAFIAILLLILAVIVSLRPSETQVQRFADYAASPEALFQQINNLRNWEEWSPWRELDPQTTVYYQGPDSGVGAIFNWSGNAKAGQGQMKIIESVPNEYLKLRLSFQRPFKATNYSEFIIRATGESTRLTWRMACRSNTFCMKMMSFLFNIDKTVGKDFEKGLAKLATAIEENQQPNHSRK